jgi:predicted metal-dependent hydrolase
MAKNQTTTVFIEGIGDVRLARRAGMKRLRLTLTPKGPLLSMPWFTPKALAISFIIKHTAWIQGNKAVHATTLIRPGALIGKTHEVRYVFTTGKTVTSRTSRSKITIAHPRSISFDSASVQTKAQQAALRVLKSEAERYLPKRLELLARQLDFDYAESRVRRMTSRWGSCSSTKLITMNIFLMQLPNNLIDYVLIHELVHTKHMDHSADFWRTFDAVLPGAKALRKAIKNYSPVLQPAYREPAVDN